MPLFLKDADVASLVEMPAIIGALENIFLKESRGETFNLPRHRFNKQESRLNVMLAGDATTGRHAIRAYGRIGSNVSHVYLYGEEGLQAVVEAKRLSSMRTGAASGVAAQRLARPDAHVVGMVGAGRQAWWQLVALKCVRPLTEVRVFARDPAKLEDFCARMTKELAIPVRPAASAQSAVEGADIALAATVAKEPVLFADWIKPGACVIGMGANAANRRELDEAIVTRASIRVTDDPAQARIEAGEFIDLVKAGRLDWASVAPLNSIVAVPPSLPRDGFTLFKSLGAGIEDLASASLVYDEALKRGVGSRV
jgi:ornithine cyclodeaminase/alanine dehydrogenase-like protein (mu-crystallin family)